MEQTYSVTVEHQLYSYPSGTTFQRIAQDFQAQYASQILLVVEDADASGPARDADL